MTSVSVICPTFQRGEHLRNLIDNYSAQTFRGPMQLIILDDSPEPCDFLMGEEYQGSDVRYIHQSRRNPDLGTKLNTLVELAEGEIVVRFDDDDYYAPNYIERMVELLGAADILTLSRWFAYSVKDRAFCYWETDTLAPTHFVVSPWDSVHTVSTEGWDPGWVQQNLCGYGFASMWRKSLFPTVRFPNIDHGEDTAFFQAAEAAGFVSKYAPDAEGLALHIIHEGNNSRMFPQYVLPEFMLHRYFPGYAGN